jgi:adenylate cyclase
MHLKRSIKYFIFTSVSAILLTILTSEANLLKKIELALLDYKFNFFKSEDKNLSEQITIIEIDQETLDYFDYNGIGWPFPRIFYAEVLNYLNECGSKAVFFDIDFSSPETERLELSSSYSEAKFFESIVSSKIALLAALIKSNANLEESFWTNKNARDSNFIVEILKPYGKLSNANLAVVNVYPNIDGVIRNLIFKFTVDSLSLYTPSIALYKLMNNLSQRQIDSIALYEYNIKNNLIELNWSNISDYKKQFNRIPFYKVLIDSYLKEKKYSHLFKDKIVFVGGAALGLMDFKPTPISKKEPMPGVYIHVCGLLTMLKKNNLQRINNLFENLILSLLIIIAAILFHFLSGVFLPIFIALILSAIYIVCSGYFFENYFIALTDIKFLLGSLGVIIIGSFNKYYFELREKRLIKKVFSRYLNPIVVEQLINDPERIEFEGKTYDIAIFFSDIKNFTSIAEKYSAKEVVKFLNEYFQICSDIMLKYDAMIDKYIGDSIMAIFGAPLEDNQKCYKACKAALEIQDTLKNYNFKNKQENKPIFETRIGLNAGEAVVGNLGAAFHLDYTAIGDSVNLASRLEGLNKLYGTNIIISETIFNEAKDYFEFRELDLIKVKGKDVAITVFELLGEKGKVDKDLIVFRDIFEIGLALYRIKDFERAKNQFEKALELKKDDTATKLYINRCLNLSKENLPKDWNGIFIAEEKF